MGPCWHYAWQTVTNLKHSQNEEVSAMEMESGYKLAQRRRLGSKTLPKPNK